MFPLFIFKNRHCKVFRYKIQQEKYFFSPYLKFYLFEEADGIKFISWRRTTKELLIEAPFEMKREYPRYFLSRFNMVKPKNSVVHSASYKTPWCTITMNYKLSEWISCTEMILRTGARKKDRIWFLPTFGISSCGISQGKTISVNWLLCYRFYDTFDSTWRLLYSSSMYITRERRVVFD